MDVTEFTRVDEKVYVSALMDLYDRNPIGVVFGRTSINEMMEETIRKAMEERNLNDLSQVIIHTDQGNIYRSYRYNQLSREIGFTPSMSRKGNCWDNAVMKASFRTSRRKCLITFQPIPWSKLRMPFQNSSNITEKNAARNA